MVLENMLHKMFGGKIPERTETNASQLKQMMSSMPPDFGEEDFWLRFPVWGVITPTDLKTETQVSQKNPQSKMTMTSPYDPWHLFQCHSC